MLLRKTEERNKYPIKPFIIKHAFPFYLTFNNLQQCNYTFILLFKIFFLLPKFNYLMLKENKVLKYYLT